MFIVPQHTYRPLPELLLGPRGLQFQFWRHPAATPSSREAVILLSGFGIHPRAFSLRAHCDWIAHWQGAGMDVFTIDLLPLAGDCTLAEQARALHDWCTSLRTAAGYTTLHAVGFSLGGLQWLAALAQQQSLNLIHGENQSFLTTLALVEAPVDLSGYPISTPARMTLRALQIFGFSHIPYRWLNPILALLAPLLQKTASWQKWANFNNLQQIPLAEIITRTFDNVPIGVARQLLRWIDGHEPSYQPAVLAGLPVLLVYGANPYSARAQVLADELARTFPVGSAQPPQLTLLPCQCAAACRVDYGHADLLLGDELRRDVFPAIQAWQLANRGRNRTS
ncbi:hypothetical protein [Chitinibacter sp. ZOR0017]|uniref:hypothetical protein n=1 Tax=Chitinibacter sp. ZOR0017 TaxID=1339254 RepID=UPI0012E015AF|nr:hypothetical protein [Chitinibacter sp. ZOR0017]